MTFPSTHTALSGALATRGYSVPTDVQLAVLDANASERDLLVSAQTGSGKTVAFGLAMASTLLGSQERFGRASQPSALIIAPTRELALQVQRELSWLYAETGARVLACVGGMDARSEARQLAGGSHIVVGTPGRLRDHLERGRLDLGQLKVAVLDEADEMLDLGFREDLEFILDATPESRRTLLFSATMPREIAALARRYQKDAVRIETQRRDVQHADIAYQAIRVAPTDVENAVVNVLRLHEVRAAIVFCATREAVKRLHARLLERGFSAVALSGELSQGERSQALQALRDGRARVLVATDVAARGLDLPDLSLVIHAELPHDAETLLHRSGRTGRAGRKGLCILLVPFNRRRKAQVLLSGAKLDVAWLPAPTPDEIRARDQERFLADPIFADVVREDEVAIVRNLQASRSADEIALALIRLHLARLPAPEDLLPDAGPPPRSDRRSNGDGRRAGWSNGDATAAPDNGKRPSRGPNSGSRDMIWFRLNIGRERNADPKWLIPLICEAGGISKSEIGSIKIFDRDTRFEITARIADKFADTVRVNKSKKGAITRVEREGFGARPRSSKPADRGAKKKHRGAASGAKA
ncbi:DEAD/DEAH box helicase [Candidatus Filomicrobium marinum]|uniref:DEAD/DEAH box helicase n=2 Tax=Filomicrobium TaxID=119044 RepID=A0A0D6JB28_9HYPH|nr:MULTISPECIES: DEAD/DEAH box helicase [Filomicrobium]CFX03408.1 DEAD/DEAH box helicase [Candidatus Filomicrobium marinum]CPR15844.1 DEAD/DEAH box helicase [Candidatus Filomicrobium marinum]SDP41713.1 ATP-dependent RNA helicase DeaD [Filomicrobium insigne]